MNSIEQWPLIMVLYVLVWVVLSWWNLEAHGDGMCPGEQITVPLLCMLWPIWLPILIIPWSILTLWRKHRGYDR